MEIETEEVRGRLGGDKKTWDEGTTRGLWVVGGSRCWEERHAVGSSWAGWAGFGLPVSGATTPLERGITEAREDPRSLITVPAWTNRAMPEDQSRWRGTKAG